MTEIKEAFEEEKKEPEESELDKMIELFSQKYFRYNAGFTERDTAKEMFKQDLIALAKRKVDECYDSLFFNPFTVQEVKRYAKQKLDEM